MEFSISSSELLKYLQPLHGVIQPNNSLVILDNILFILQKDHLSIRASDSNNTLIGKIEDEIHIKTPGEMAVPAKLIVDVLKSFAFSEQLNFAKKENILEIQSKQGNYKLAIKEAEDFPPLPTVEKKEYFSIDSEIFLNALNKTSFAVANDDARPIISGLYFNFSENGSLFVATDGHKLVKYHLKEIKSLHPLAFILHKKTLNLLKSILADRKEEVKIELNDTYICFYFDDTTLISRLIEGKYPNYEAVIPKENDKKFSVDKANFLNTIKRLSLFCPKANHSIVLKCNASSLHLKAEDADFSHQGEEQLDYDYNSEEETKIGFSSRFLIEMLSKLDAKEITFEILEPIKPVVIKPSNPQQGEELIMILSPIIIATT